VAYQLDPHAWLRRHGGANLVTAGNRKFAGQKEFLPLFLRPWSHWAASFNDDATIPLSRWLADGSAAYGVANLLAKALPVVLVDASPGLEQPEVPKLNHRNYGVQLKITYQMEGTFYSWSRSSLLYPRYIWL